MFYKKDNGNYKNAFNGVTYKTLVYGEKTSLGEFFLKKGSIVPNHNHPHEQTGYMISGRMTLTGKTIMPKQETAGLFRVMLNTVLMCLKIQ